MTRSLPNLQGKNLVAGRAISPGLLDAALSSLATFLVGFHAARSLEPAALGGTPSSFRRSYSAPGFPPNCSLFIRNRVRRAPGTCALVLLSQSLRLGALPALVSALGVSVWVFVAPPQIPHDVVLALTITGVASAAVSPAQDHVRRMLHLGESSWSAASVSACQVGGVIAGIAVLTAAGVPAPWVRLASLAFANVSSLALGVGLARIQGRAPAETPILLVGTLVQAGVWLVVVGLLPAGAAFVAVAVVSHLAGPDALGYAEAAGSLGRVPFVLSTGLTAGTWAPLDGGCAQSRPRYRPPDFSTIYGAHARHRHPLCPRDWSSLEMEPDAAPVAERLRSRRLFGRRCRPTL